MTKNFRSIFQRIPFDNPKSKTCPFDILRAGSELSRRIQNLKWLGLSVIAFVLVVAGAVAEAQQPKKVPQLGFLASSSGERLKSRGAAFEQGLRDLGYVGGKTIVIDYRSAEGKFDRLPELAAEMVRMKVDIIVAEGAPAAHAAKNATAVIPIVIGNAADPVATGLVASLAHPGGNITGLSDFNLTVVTKRLEIIKEVVPKASRIAVLWNPNNPTNPLQLKELEPAAKALKVILVSIEAKNSDDLEPAFNVIKTQRVPALLVMGDPMFGTHARRIADLAAKSRLPSMFHLAEFVDSGGLVAYGVDRSDQFRRAATFVDKILKGRTPADLPVEQPMRFELVFNLKTAKQIGLTIPPNVLVRAQRVIR